MTKAMRKRDNARRREWIRQMSNADFEAAINEYVSIEPLKDLAILAGAKVKEDYTREELIKLLVAFKKMGVFNF